MVLELQLRPMQRLRNHEKPLYGRFLEMFKTQTLLCPKQNWIKGLKIRTKTEKSQLSEQQLFLADAAAATFDRGDTSTIFQKSNESSWSWLERARWLNQD